MSTIKLVSSNHPRNLIPTTCQILNTKNVKKSEKKKKLSIPDHLEFCSVHQIIAIATNNYNNIIIIVIIRRKNEKW